MTGGIAVQSLLGQLLSDLRPLDLRHHFGVNLEDFSFQKKTSFRISLQDCDNLSVNTCESAVLLCGSVNYCLRQCVFW